MTSRDRHLPLECRVFTRYLIGEEPTPMIEERYGRACELLLPTYRRRSDERILRFARRHGRLIGILDAGAGFIYRATILRRKLLILTAILETSPDYTQHFLPREVSAPGIVLRALWNGAWAVVKIALGVPLVKMVSRR